MKKILLAIMWLFILSTQVFWYEITNQDYLLNFTITNKLEDYISKKWERSRPIVIKQIQLFKNQHKNNEKVQSLIEMISKNIQDSNNIKIQNNIIKELDKNWIPDLKFLSSTWAIENIPFLLSDLLEEKESQFNQLISTPNEKINFSTLRTYYNNDKLSYLFSLLHHFDNINSNEKLRKTIEIFQQPLGDFNNKTSFSKKLYEIYKTIQKDKTLDTEQQRIINKAIKQFELNWINLSEENLSKIKDINQELTKASFEFWTNLLNAEKEFSYYVDTLETIKEMPTDILESTHEEAIKQGKTWYLFNYNNADYLLWYSTDSTTRNEIRNAYKSIASSGKYDNREIILKILKLRQELTQILWYKNYWEYSLASKMAPSPEFVMNQEDQILAKAKIKWEKELNEIKEYFHITWVNASDYAYYSRILQKEKYQLDDNVLREYFEYEKVKEWLFNIANKLYWLEFKELESELYNENAKIYEVYRDWELKWYYILDPFYNPNKSSWAWATILRDTKEIWNSKTLPIVINVININKGKENTLLTYNELNTLFHEFWHALHALLSDSKYSELNWFNVEWDFVELPSQLMENWTYWEWLKTFAYNYKTWELISEELIDKINKSKTSSSWIRTITQIFYSREDMLFHTIKVPDTVEELDKLNSEIVESIGIFKNDTKNKSYASFSHIFDWGYEAGYYSYLWAEIIESDIFSKFEENWIFNTETSKKFYDTILSQWSRKPAIELFKDFMWRDIQLDWFYKKKGF